MLEIGKHEFQNKKVLYLCLLLWLFLESLATSTSLDKHKQEWRQGETEWPRPC